MTWKNCMCCSKRTKRSSSNENVEIEEPFGQSNVSPHSEEVARNQSAAAFNNETLRRFTENERNEHKDLNYREDNTNINDPEYYLNENEKDRSVSFHTEDTVERFSNGNDDELRCSVNDEDERNQGNIESREPLNTFLNRLYNEIKINLSDKEVADINVAVQNLVFYLLGELGQYEPTLKSSELVRTGSCYDDTKILQPNEFDFLAVIDCFSFNEFTTVDVSTRSCSFGGYAHAVCTEKSPDWSRVIEQGDDNSVIACLKSRSFRTAFRDRFHTILHKEINRSYSVETPAGSLQLKGFSVPINGPQCNVKVSWTSKKKLTGLKIDIDISPAIKCCLRDTLTSSDVINEEVFKVMSQEKFVYLIPRPKRTCIKCFKMIFPQTDQHLVMKLSETHRKVLVILKYISHEVLHFNFFLKTIFNSFTMKNALLRHSLIFCKETHCQYIGECLMTTLQYIKHRLDKHSPYLTSVFTVSRNLWENAEEKEISQVLAILRNVLKLFSEIKRLKFKDFNHDQLKNELSLSCSNSIPLSADLPCVSE